MKSSFALFISGCFIASLLVLNTSCKKETDCIANIKCINDSTGLAASGAAVQLYAIVKDGTTTYTADVKAQGTTDGSGFISFKFKLPAILDVTATTSLGGRTFSGHGIVKLEEGKTVEETVHLSIVK